VYFIFNHELNWILIQAFVELKHLKRKDVTSVYTCTEFCNREKYHSGDFNRSVRDIYK